MRPKAVGVELVLESAVSNCRHTLLCRILLLEFHPMCCAAGMGAQKVTGECTRATPPCGKSVIPGRVVNGWKCTHTSFNKEISLVDVVLTKLQRGAYNLRNGWTTRVDEEEWQET